MATVSVLPLATGHSSATIPAPTHPPGCSETQAVSESAENTAGYDTFKTADIILNPSDELDTSWSLQILERFIIRETAGVKH